MIVEVSVVPEQTKEDIATEMMVKNFNLESERQKTKYHMAIHYNYPHLYKKFLFFLGDEVTQIYYDKNANLFQNCKELDNETFEKIKPILEKIEDKFKIRLKENHKKEYAIEAEDGNTALENIEEK